jgi:hypothetical protein
MQTKAVTRPRAVTAATVLAWIEGNLTILGGVLVLTLLARENDSLVQSVFFYVSFVTIGIGLVTVFVAGGLLGGSRGARVAITVLLALSMLVGGLGVAQGQTLLGVTALMALVSVCLLWLGQARPYFRNSRQREKSRRQATLPLSPAPRP